MTEDGQRLRVVDHIVGRLRGRDFHGRRSGARSSFSVQANVDDGIGPVVHAHVIPWTGRIRVARSEKPDASRRGDSTEDDAVLFAEDVGARHLISPRLDTKVRVGAARHALCNSGYHKTEPQTW